MAYSYVNYTGDGNQVNYSVPYSYLEKPHVLVYVQGLLKTLTTHYTWLNDSVIQFNTAPLTDEIISLVRSSGRDVRLVDFQTSSILDEDTLDLNSNQLFYLMQEAFDALAVASGEDSAIFSTPTAILDAFQGSIGLEQLDPTVGAAVGYLNTNYINDAIYEFDEDGTVVYEDEVYHHGYTKLVWIDGNLLVTGSITAAKIAADQIEATHMAIDSILAASIKAGEIDTGHLAADCITATEIEALAVDTASLAAGAVEADKINVTSLSAIIADLGTITAGNITIDSSGFIRSNGKDNFADNTAGFFLGYDTDAYKFNLGDAANFLSWDGSALIIAGELAGVTVGDYLEIASDYARNTGSGTWLKRKEILCGRTGTWRVSHNSKGQVGTVHSRVYKNGVVHPNSTEYEESDDLWHNHTEDLAFDAGDTIELWYMVEDGVGTGYVRYFRVWSSMPIVCIETMS